MYNVEKYGRVRRAVLRDGMSHSEAARVFGVDRGTISKMTQFSEPPGYRLSKQRPRSQMDAHADFVDAILLKDRDEPKKQHHTIKRIYERLCEERSFKGGYTTVRDYVRPRRQALKESFVPLAHPPGHAQADFGEATVVLGGVRQKVRYFVMSLPHSDAVFVKAYHAETAEAFCDALPGRRLQANTVRGHVEAFAFFGGVPQSILYDNTKLAVAKILGDGTRKRSALFAALQSHYLFDDRFGRPGRGNDKGAVEGMVGFSRRTFMVPVPEAVDIGKLNTMLAERCRERQSASLRGSEGASISDLLVADREAFLPEPAVPFEPCDKRPGTASSQALVRYRNTDYSVPVAYAHQRVVVRGYVDEVVIEVAGEEVARHARSYAVEDFVFDAIPSLNKKMVLELARGEFVSRRENLIALGPSGVGKTHISLGIGLAACQKGVKTRFATAAAIVHEMIEARDEKRLLRFQKQLASVELLIIPYRGLQANRCRAADELGFVPLSKTGAELLFELISQRYERGATIITSNLPFDEWTATFGEERLTGALLDRLTHHVHILEMNGQSYRLAQSKARKAR